jgi:hypothetical protein
LAEQLTAEQPVIFELLIAALEDGSLGGLTVATGRRPFERKTLQQIDPQIGHSV